MTAPSKTDLRYTIPEACALLKVSRRTLYNRIESGDLAVIHDGRRVFITNAELRRYAAGTKVPVNA